MYTMFAMNTSSESQIIRINSREARAKWRDLLDTIYRGASGIVIERYGKPVAALVTYEDFERLQQTAVSSQIAEPQAAYTTAAKATNSMNDVDNMDLNELLHSLPADALELVTAFARLMQSHVAETAVSTTPTVTMPAAKLDIFFQLLTEGYDGDALADSEDLYDDA